MRKGKFLFLICVVFFVAGGFLFAIESTPDNQYEINTIIKTLKTPVAPFVSNGYLVFTASPLYKSNSAKIRHVGISLDSDNFKQVRSFEELIFYDVDNNPTGSVLFYIMKLPENTTNVKYKMVIDGLWTTDPLNPKKEYNSEASTWLSVIEYENPTKQITASKNNSVKFIYEGKSGEKVRLSGNFTNWDSFIYYLTETSVGHYELSLPLTKGTYYYTFYLGLNAVLDPNNPNRVYTPEGRVASVIDVS